MDELLKEERLEELVQAMLGAFEQFEPGTTANDQKAQLEAIRRMALAEKEIQAILAEQDGAVKALLKKKGGKESNKDDRVKILLQAFEFCVKRRDVVDNVLGDVRIYKKITNQIASVLKKLEEIEPGGERLLVPFLDHAHPAIRASAASILLDLMPARALPVLRKVREEHRGTSAGMLALRTLIVSGQDLPENESESGSNEAKEN